MARNTAMPSGYDYEFVKEVPEDYVCVICQLAMRNPVLTNCGHQFCKECLNEAYKRGRQCPVDREPLTPEEIFPNKFTERKILSFHIKCPDKGCDWEGELRHIESHESRCDYKVVDCDNEGCRVRKSRCEMVRHQKECLYRMVPCPHCQNTCRFCLLEEHTGMCPKSPISCPNHCGKTLKREEVISHLLDECPLTTVPCSYQSIGCTFKVKRIDWNEHIENHVKQHLNIAVGKIVSLQEQMDEMKKQTALTNQRIQKQMDEMKKELIASSAHVMTRDDNGYLSYIWEIKDVSNILMRPIITTSDPFYTHKNGYKLSLSLSKQSIGLIVMHGEYDNVLTWPFHIKEVSFTLMSQSTLQWDFESEWYYNVIVQKPRDLREIASVVQCCIPESVIVNYIYNPIFLKVKMHLEKSVDRPLPAPQRLVVRKLPRGRRR